MVEKKEWKELRKRARKDPNAKKELYRQIKQAKAECWAKWIQEGRDVWQCARVARNPFGMNKRCGDITAEDGTVATEDQEKGRLFAQYNLVNELRAATDIRHTTKRVFAGNHQMAAIHQLLKKIKNTSTPGPDGISWRLWKIIKDTEIGRRAIEDAAQCGSLESEQPQEWIAARIVMIPKPGKDLSSVKGWRPITLANTIGKLAEKLVAVKVGEMKELWHEMAFAGRKSRGAVDSVMLAREIQKKHDDMKLVGRDIKSAFNGISKDICIKIFEGHGQLQTWIAEFLNPRNIDIYVDGRKVYNTTMTGGTPQGSPLSPALFTVYISALI